MKRVTSHRHQSTRSLVSQSDASLGDVSNPNPSSQPNSSLVPILGVSTATAEPRPSPRATAPTATATSQQPLSPVQQREPQSRSLHPALAPPSSDHTQGVKLDSFEVKLGPDLRAFFPVVLTTQVKGCVSLSGPLLDPSMLTATGEVGLESGTLNLVATQFTLDRDHSNRILFLNEGSQGVLDPMIDLVWVSGDLRATVKGRSSAWQDSFSLSASGTPLPSSSSSSSAAQPSASANASSRGKAAADSSSVRSQPAEGTALSSSTTTPSAPLDPPPQSIPIMGHMGSNGGSMSSMEPSEVARVFEERLAEALVGENGQLAIKSLATSTFSTLLPKLETRGQFGAARWRLVGAPYSLPNLLRVIDPISSTTEGNGGRGGKGLGSRPSSSNLLNSEGVNVNAGGSSGSRMDPYRLISSLAAGTELELEVGSGRGRSFKARVVVHTGGTTEATATYRIGERVRLQLSLARVSKLMLQYSSD